MSGSSALDGPDGNIRTFTAGGVSVKASAFSRDKSTGAWSTAFLGSYGGGLGVTDSSEGDGGNNSHTVDNIDRDNYVLFEFSENGRRRFGLPGLRRRRQRPGSGSAPRPIRSTITRRSATRSWPASASPK